MNSVYIPSQNPEDWKRFLAEPEKQWRSGYSAKELATCWEQADGFPKEIELLLKSHRDLKDIEMLLAIPEYKVPLPGGGRASQNDLFVLGRDNSGLVVIMVEGKVAEPFGPTLEDWMKDASEGKSKRLEYLLGVLQLDNNIPKSMRYQLLHRTASSLIVAQKFHAEKAIMLVHSFSTDNVSYNDFIDFLSCYNVQPQEVGMHEIQRDNGPRLFLGWASH